MMSAADANGDGMVDYTEFLTAAFDKQKLINDQSLQRAFHVFDADGDGQISKEELQNVFAKGAVASDKGEEVWEEIMRGVDQDGDGVISYDEFRDCMFKVLENRATFYNKQ